MFDRLPGTEESIERGLITEESDHNSARPANNTTGNQYDAIEKPAELHRDVPLPIVLQVHHHRKPRLDVPCQGRDDQLSASSSLIRRKHLSLRSC